MDNGHRKYVDTLCRGDVVMAKQDLDPEGANVKQGDLGVVFEESNAYNDQGGPMIRWMRAFTDATERASCHPGGCCNVYDGDVVKVGR